MANPFADELEIRRRAKPCTLVIFGASGDLTHRKLVPSLLGLAVDGLLPAGFSVVGFARRPKTDHEFQTDLLQALRQHAGGDAEAAFVEQAPGFFYQRGDYDDPASYEALAATLARVDARRGTQGNRIFYLATPPSAYSPILGQLRDSGLSKERDGGFARVIIEKPFGRDLDSARALNDQVATGFEEHQVFRIDHYLGKETVQNILALRFANGIFEPLWNNKFVDHVQITVAESIGVGTRGGYFEQAGIIRDMIQNHLLQVLTLIAMEPPISLSANAVRNEKVKVLQAIHSLTPDAVLAQTVRGQYVRDFVAGEEVLGYREESGVAADSATETYAAIRLDIDNWRWSGTPFFLRSGKRMPRRVTEAAIHFRQPPMRLFDGGAASPNILLLRIQPDEGVSLRFGSKVPGPDMRIRDVRMDFRYGSSFGTAHADAYERLLLDAMIGDSTLFARRDEVEEAWRIVDSIVAGWKSGPLQPLPYGAGSWGPAAADALLDQNRVFRMP